MTTPLTTTSGGDASLAETTEGEENSSNYDAGEDTMDDDENTEEEEDDDQDFQDALEDVHTRFILNLPSSELEKTEGMFFQLEQAWWFYEDFICDNAPPEQKLPRFSHLRPFAMQMFQYSPLLPDPSKFKGLWNEFTQFKRKISNFGCILLNEACTKVVLCQVWNGKSHTFPSGKINQGETGIEAAARETFEETGFDPHCEHGKTRDLLIKANTTGQALPWLYPLQEQDALSYQEADGGKRRTCYVCCGVPEDFPFAPECRKEVSKIAWYPIDNIPKPNYAVAPFLSQLKRWIKKRQRKDRQGGKGNNKTSSAKKNKKQRNKNSSKKDRNKNKSRERNKQYKTPQKGRGSNNNTPSSSRPGSRQRMREHEALVEAGLAQAGDTSGWSEEDMFQVNEKILGRRIEYDGNPHYFSEHGFGGKDPHAFHVVGGTFLNSEDGGISSLAPPPQTSKLQPLFRKGGDGADGEGDELQPFFSDEGATPWGDVVSEAKAVEDGAARTIPAANRSKSKDAAAAAAPDDEDAVPGLFMTDAEITRRSQAIKTQQQKNESQNEDPITMWEKLKQQRMEQYQADMDYIRKWVANLPKPRATPHFGEFKLDAHAIMEKALNELPKA